MSQSPRVLCEGGAREYRHATVSAADGRGIFVARMPRGVSDGRRPRQSVLICDDLAVLPVIGSAAIETTELSIGRSRRRIRVGREHDGLIPTHGAAIRG